VRPVHLERIRSDPLLLRFFDFVSSDEAGHLVALALPRLEPSTIVGEAPGARARSAARTSETAYLPEDAVTRRVQARAVALSGCSTCELLQVVSYTRGQEFRPHLDQFDETSPGGLAEIRSRGQRRATFLVCLACPVEGGATVFPALGLAFAPVQGSAIYWTHQDAAGRTHPGTIHGGAPVVYGRKLALNIWLR
jgi:prolyl 4-hydroxylase